MPSAAFLRFADVADELAELAELEAELALLEELELEGDEHPAIANMLNAITLDRQTAESFLIVDFFKPVPFLTIHNKTS